MSAARFARLTVLAALACAAFGQTAAVTEPEFADVFFGLQAGQLVKLERQTGTIRTKMTGIGTANGFTEFPGAKSPVRFRGGQPVELVVRSLVPTEDPEAQYHLRKLESKKNNRLSLLVHASVFGASVKSPAEGALPVEFSRYGESSLKMTVAALPPGEYAVTHGQTAFCFGVD